MEADKETHSSNFHAFLCHQLPDFCSGVLRREMESVRHAVELEHETLFSSAYQQLIVSGSDDYQECPPHHGQFAMIDVRLSAQCAGLITHV